MLISKPRLPTPEPVTLLVGAWRCLPRLIGWATSPHERTCVVCGDPVLDHEPFLRYHGEYYHAEPCLEADPPALRGHRLTDTVCRP